jgi:acylphosphatase
MKTLHLRILGRVQGVWFRESMPHKGTPIRYRLKPMRSRMRNEAESLGVTGWVCNRADGSVEAVIQGSTQAVDTLLDWAHAGPPMARVERVIIDEAQGQFSRFEKRAG